MSEPSSNGKEERTTAEAPGKSREEADELSSTWRKIEVLGRPAAGFLTALSVALIGWFGQTWLSQREQEITKRTEIQQDTRLYTELMSRREEFESALRKDMFATILGQFLKGSENELSEASISSRLLKLELLALNFGDSLSLSPLFLELSREIDREAQKTLTSDPVRDRYRKRLQSLSRRVSSAQVAALTPVGKVLEIEVPLDRVDDANGFLWPHDLVTEQQKELEETPAWADAQGAKLSEHELRGVKRAYSIMFSEPDLKNKTVDVHLRIRDVGSGEDMGDDDAEARFQLNFFNFPMIDNMRLSGDQRFALVLERFDTTGPAPHLHAVGVCFPGMYASLRDKPFLDDIIQKLKGTPEDARVRGKGL